MLRGEFNSLEWPDPSATITSNYTIGGLVSAADVAGTRTHLRGHSHELTCDALDAQKIDEAMGVAEHLGLSFCEATDLYRGMQGSLN